MTCPNNVSWCNGPGSFGQMCLSCKKGKQPAADLTEPKAATPSAVARRSSGSPARVTGPEPVKPHDVPSTSRSNNEARSSASTSTSVTDQTLPSKESPWEIADKRVSGGPLGVGSYKSAWAIDDDPTHVLVTVASDKRQLITSELTSLQTLEKAGCRVVGVSEAIYDVPDGRIGVIMEKLDGTEVKETRFMMTTQKQAILGAARIYGIEKTCAQLQAVAAFIDKHGGISDLQFVVSGKCGMVLFDPATLGTKEGSGNLKAMILFLKNQVRKPL